jgi:hypothetical protein
MDGRPNDRRSDGVARNDLRLVLDLFDDVDRSWIIGHLGNDWKANDEKKGKLAQRTSEHA